MFLTTLTTRVSLTFSSRGGSNPNLTNIGGYLDTGISSLMLANQPPPSLHSKRRKQKSAGTTRFRHGQASLQAIKR